MSEPIIYLDRSEIRRGKLGELKQAMSELAAFVQEHEPQLISYAFYLDEQGSTMTVVAVHPDSRSMEFHIAVAGERFRRFKELITLPTIELYGRPSEKVLKQLQQKAEMLGERSSVVVNELHAGFGRVAVDGASAPESR